MRFTPITKCILFATIAVTASTTAVAGYAYVGSAGYRTTNGNKVVVGPNNELHSVYVEAGAVKYRCSLDGTTFSDPVIISDSGQLPAIAVDGAGNLGVVFSNLAVVPSLFYSGRLNTRWSGPVQVDGNAATEASIVSSATSFHVAWRRGNDIMATQFPTTTWAPLVPGLWATNSRAVALLCVCFDYETYTLPSIAVVSGSTDTVWVGFFANAFLPSSNQRRLAAVVRQPGPSATTNGTEVYRSSRTLFNTTLPPGSVVEGVSLSLAASSSGHLFLAWSDIFPLDVSANKVPRTMLTHYGPGGTWAAPVDLPPTTPGAKPSLVDVIARSQTPENFRVVWSERGFDLNGVPNPYGPVRFWAGTWTGLNPTWIGAATTVTGPLTSLVKGRDPQAIFWERSCAPATCTSSYQKLRVLYDRRFPATTYRIQEYSGSALCPIICLPPDDLPTLNVGEMEETSTHLDFQ